MKYYAKAKQTDNVDEIYARFEGSGVDRSSVVVDTEIRQKQAGSIYNQLKTELSQHPEDLTLDSLFSIGKNAREISKELAWFKEHGIEIYALDLPSTLSKRFSRTDILLDVNAMYADREMERLKAGQQKSQSAKRKAGVPRKTSPGRPRMDLPDNWEEEYVRWYNRETSSAEFMAAVGLSQGTFYNCLSRYGEQQRMKKLEEQQDIDKEQA